MTVEPEHPAAPGVVTAEELPGRSVRTRSSRVPWLLPTPLEVALILSFVLLTRQLSSCDLWWHLKSGQSVVESGIVPRVDRWSLVSAGTPWMNPSWLWDSVAWLITRHGGLGFLLALKGLVASMTLLAIVRISWDSGARSGVALIVSLLVGLVSLRSQFWNLRPQMVSPLFGAVFALILRRYERKISDHLVLLPLIMVVWANTHAGYALGLVLILLAAVGQVPSFVRGEPEGLLRLKRLGAVFGGSVIASWINPYGPAQTFYPLFHAGNAALRSRISEWGPTILRDEPLVLAVFLFLVILLMVAPRRDCPLSEVLFVSLGVYMTCDAVRHHFVLGLCVAPTIALAADACVLSLRSRDPGPFPRTAMAWIWITIALCLSWGQREVASLPGFYPVKSVAELKNDPHPGLGYNQFELGGYLLYHLPAGYRPFIDGRVDTHIASGGFERYLTVWDVKPGWETILDQYHIDWALLESGCALARALETEGWSTSAVDGSWRLLKRPPKPGGAPGPAEPGAVEVRGDSTDSNHRELPMGKP